MAYLLDANVFIEAKNRHYGLDFCPAFWDWLAAKNLEQIVFSIEKVEDELAAGADELTDWAAERGERFFLKPDPGILPQLGKVSVWANDQDYEPGAINTFLQAADYYLCAHALAQEHVVVTHEVPSPSTKRIKIPNVCIGLRVTFMTPFQMLRRERARFVLGGR